MHACEKKYWCLATVIKRFPCKVFFFFLQQRDIRYLQCPAAVSVAHLKKFIRLKFDLPPKYTVRGNNKKNGNSFQLTLVVWIACFHDDINTIIRKWHYFLWFLLLQIDIYHSDEPLKDFFTLMDIAYIYTWRRVWNSKSKSVECITMGSEGYLICLPGGGGNFFLNEFSTFTTYVHAWHL